MQDPTNRDWENAEICSTVAHAGARVAVRITAEELSRVARDATEANLSLASFIRGVVLERVSRPTSGDAGDS